MVENEIIEMARYMIKEQSTIQKTAERFGRNKMTVHRWMTKRLFDLNKGLYEEVRALLDKNKAERSERGGKATQCKFEEMRKCDIIQLARYIVDQKTTLQEVADKFEIGKAVAYKYLKKNLRVLDESLYNQFVKVMKNNKAEAANRAREAIQCKQKATK